MQPAGDSTSHEAIRDELRRAALETYGEERSAEALLQTMLNAAATAVWRLSEESLEPMDHEPRA
jgi:hypothetical protein